MNRGAKLLRAWGIYHTGKRVYDKGSGGAKNLESLSCREKSEVPRLDRIFSITGLPQTVGTADTDRLIGAGIVADDTVTSSSMNWNICLNPIFPPLVTTFVVSGRSWSARWFSI